MLPYFLRHYKRLTDSITIWDNGSTDRSVEIMKANGVKVRYYESGDEIRDDIMMQVKNQCWKSSRYRDDWVIVVDIDEFVYKSDLASFLSNTNQTVLRPFGYCMLCRTMPRPHDNLPEVVKWGVADKQYNKACLFRPDCVGEINFTVGAHEANPVGPKVLEGQDVGLKLLHYNYLTLEYHLARYKERGARLSRNNIAQSWGTVYLRSPEELTAKYRELEAEAQLVV